MDWLSFLIAMLAVLIGSLLWIRQLKYLLSAFSDPQTTFSWYYRVISLLWLQGIWLILSVTWAYTILYLPSSTVSDCFVPLILIDVIWQWWLNKKYPLEQKLSIRSTKNIQNKV